MFMHGEYESKRLIILEHPVGVGHFLELVKITVRLLERIAPEQVDILLEEVVVFVCLALTLRPLNLEAEDAGILSQDVSLQQGEVDVFGRFYDRFVVFIANVVAAAEELLLFVCGG